MKKKELTFVVIILYILGQHWNMTTPEVYDILNSTGILDDYIIKCYEVKKNKGICKNRFLKSALDLIVGIITPSCLITKLYENFAIWSMDISIIVAK